MVLRQDLLRLLPLPAWRAFFKSLAPSFAVPSTLEAIPAAILATSDLALFDVISTLTLLADDDGYAAILRAAADARVDPSAFPQGDSAALAHWLLVSAKSDPSLAPLIASARVQLLELPPRELSFELVARDADKLRTFRAPRDLSARLSTALADAFERDGRARTAEVQVVEDDRDWLSLDVLRADHRRSVLAVETRALTRLSSDLLRLDKSRGRLVISTKAQSLPPMYRRIIGEALFANPDFFAASPSVDLRPLQDRGEAALKAPGLDALIGSTRVIELDWDSGEDDVLTVTGRNVLAALGRRGLALHGGTFERATLRLEFVDGGSKADVMLAPPHGLTVHPDARRSAVVRYLDAAAWPRSSALKTAQARSRYAACSISAGSRSTIATCA